MKSGTFSGRQVVKVLARNFGFEFVRQRGSHMILRRFEGERKIGTVVPDHKELQRGTLRGVLRLAEIDEASFLKKAK